MSHSFKRAWAWHGRGRAFYSVAGDGEAMGMAGGAVGWGPSRKEVAEGRPASLMGEHSPVGTDPSAHTGASSSFPSAFAR